MKTSELIGADLNWLVAKCEGLLLHKNVYLNGVFIDEWSASGYFVDPNMWIGLGALQYSSKWAQGGPIIEREKITLSYVGEARSECRADIEAGAMMYGSTPLIAAMRCYVASKLGDEVEVPEELK
jgi:hypothetical protein